MMLEKHRLTYLDTLGIENYMPRYQLKNALPSQLLSNDALREPIAFSTADIKDPSLIVDDISHNVIPQNTSQNAHEEKDDSTVSKVVPPVAADVMSLLGIASKAGSSADSSASAKSPNISASNKSSIQKEGVQQKDSHLKTNPEAHQRDIRFSLNIWRIKSDILVIDSREPAVALPIERLLQNVLRSIGISLAQLPPSDLLRWPLFSSKKFVKNKVLSEINSDQSSEEDEARAMVQAYVSAQFGRAPINTLLLLGKSAASFALTPTSNEDVDTFYELHKGKLVDTTLWEAKVLVAPSLVEMLHEPMQKRLTWQALQALFVE
jgi:hypothetical protein